MSDDEIAAITRWAANGAPRGEGDEPVVEQPAAAGAKPYRFPAGSARLLQRGRKMVGDFHYHPKGEAATDRTRIGFWFAEPEEVEKELVTLPIWNAGINIPAVDVRWGLESTDEMLNGLVDYVAADG